VTAVLVVGGAGGTWAWSEHEDRVAAARAAADERAADAHAAQVVDADALQVQATDAGRVRAATVRADAGAALAAGADHARATLATSQDAVADDAVRQTLAAELSAADAATGVAGVAAAAPGPSATDAVSGPPSAPGLSLVSLRALAASLAAADAAVAAAHDAWVQEQAAAEAARQAAAAAAATAKKPAKAAAAGPSCGTTYSGPPFYTSPATVGGDGSNGRLPPSALTAISWDVDPHGTPYYLKNAAAAALERLDVAFRAAFGHHLDLDLTYRDYDTQVAMRNALGTVAATPGTSTHGTGLALDVPELPCEYGYDTPQRDWLVSHGPSYGWASPSWAARTGSNPEYWHFEYVG
jgi:D-alanyl-D-alanine carboxypeptidase